MLFFAYYANRMRRKCLSLQKNQVSSTWKSVMLSENSLKISHGREQNKSKCLIGYKQIII